MKRKLPTTQAHNENLPAPAPAQGTAKLYIDDIPAHIIRQALLPLHPVSCPLQEMISSSQAVFEFIHNADINQSLKNACCQLEKQFDFYKNLLLLSGAQPMVKPPAIK